MDKKMKQAGRIIAFLSREQIEFLDKLANDSLFTTGRKLSRTKIISALIDTIRSFNVDARDARTEQALKEKLAKELKKGKAEDDITQIVNSLSSDYKSTKSTRKITDKIIKKVQEHKKKDDEKKENFFG